MAILSLLRGALGLEDTAIENVTKDLDGSVVFHVRPMARQRGRCGRCRRRSPRYDPGAGRRRWRTLDHGVAMAFLEADAPRVRCAEHGVVVAHVPWAVHGAGHTHTFDQQVAWLVVRTSKSAVTELMRIAWRTAGAILDRVWTQLQAEHGGSQCLTKPRHLESSLPIADGGLGRHAHARTRRIIVSRRGDCHGQSAQGCTIGNGRLPIRGLSEYHG